MATHAEELVKEDLLDRYVHAQMRLRALLVSADNPNLRTCTSCGERVKMRYDQSGWSVVSVPRSGGLSRWTSGWKST